MQFGDVLPFLEQNTDLAHATCRKLLTIVRDPQTCCKLQLELAAVIDCGQPFVKATYKLEGDGALVYSCYDILSSLTLGIQAAHYPNLCAVTVKLSGGDNAVAQQLQCY